MATPQTQRSTSDHDGRPCVHMADEDHAVLQVHHRGDQPTGFLIQVVNFPELFGVPMPTATYVYLTQGQAQELCDYFRSVL